MARRAPGGRAWPNRRPRTRCAIPRPARCTGSFLDHFETFRAHAVSLRDGDGLPRFVEQEFRDFLRCGCLAVAQDRLHVTDEGGIWLTLRHRWADGTTHLRFDPLELLERLAVLTPRPRVNLILYYGVLAPRPAWRAALVPPARSGDLADEAHGGAGVHMRASPARTGLAGIDGPS